MAFAMLHFLFLFFAIFDAKKRNNSSCTLQQFFVGDLIKICRKRGKD